MNRPPVTILLDDCPEPCRNDRLYSANPCFQLIRKFRQDQTALIYKKLEYIECLSSHSDNLSIRRFMSDHPLIDTSDFEYMKKLVLFRGWIIRLCPPMLTSNRNFMLQVVREHQVCYRYASNELRSDRKLLETALDLSMCGNDLFTVLTKVDFSDIPDLGIVSLFRHPTRLFKFVTCEKLRNDVELKKKAKEIKSNRELVLQAIKYHGSVLRYVHSKCKSDVHVVFTALDSGHYNMIKWASKSVLASCELLIKLTSSNMHMNNHYVKELFQNQGEVFWRKVAELNLSPPIPIPRKFFDIREIALFAVKLDGNTLRYAYGGVNDDMEVVKIATDSVPAAIKYASNRLRNNLDLMLPILTKKHDLIVFASDDILKSLQVASIVLNKDISLLKHFHESIRNNVEFLISLPLDVSTIMSAPLEVRSNRSFIESLVRRNSKFFRSASKELREDVEYVKKLIEIDQNVILHISDCLKNNVEMMNYVISNNAKLFPIFSKSLRSNIDLIKKSVDLGFQQGISLDSIYQNIILCSIAKKEDKEEIISIHQLFGKKCTTTSPLQYAHPMLFFDRDYVLELYGENHGMDYLERLALLCIDPTSKTQKDLIDLFSFSDEIRHANIPPLIERLFAYFDARHCGAVIYLSKHFRSNLSFEMLSEEMLSNIDLIRSLTLDSYRGWRVLHYVESSSLPKDLSLEIITTKSLDDKTYRKLLFCNDDEFVISAVKKDGSLLKYTTLKHQDDKIIVTAAIENDANALSFASSRLKNDKQIVTLAVRQNANTFYHASEDLKNDLSFVRYLCELTRMNSILFQFASPSVQMNMD